MFTSNFLLNLLKCKKKSFNFFKKWKKKKGGQVRRPQTRHLGGSDLIFMSISTWRACPPRFFFCGLWAGRGGQPVLPPLPVTNFNYKMC